MATKAKAVLEAKVQMLEYVLDLIPQDPDDEDAPNNLLANDLEMLRHKTIAEINAQTKVRDAQDVWDRLTEVGIDFESVVTRAGSKPNHATDRRRAIFLGKLAELEIAFGEYMGEVHNQ